MKPRVPFSCATAAYLQDAANPAHGAEWQRAFWRQAALARSFDYIRAGVWWWPFSTYRKDRKEHVKNAIHNALTQ